MAHSALPAETEIRDREWPPERGIKSEERKGRGGERGEEKVRLSPGPWPAGNQSASAKRGCCGPLFVDTPPRTTNEGRSRAKGLKIGHALASSCADREVVLQTLGVRATDSRRPGREHDANRLGRIAQCPCGAPSTLHTHSLLAGLTRGSKAGLSNRKQRPSGPACDW